MTIRDIAVAFGFEVDQRSERQAENSIKGIKNMATKLLGAIGIGFSIAGLGSLAEAAADAEALRSQFGQVFDGIEEQAAGKLAAIADDTGVAVNRMKGSFVQISAFAKTTGMETSDALALADRSMVAIADSAAFYDRSLEDVTDSLRSFLKGNFENDAALGLSCTETTRNAAANAMYGKSFKDLAEDQKQLTLLKMVEDANAASGALGQAARESDTWTNQLGNLKQNLKDLRAVAGSTFLRPAVAVLKTLSGLTKAAADRLQELTGEGGALTKIFDRMHAIVKKLKPEIDRMMQTLSNGASRGIGFIKGAVDKLGGMENAMKIASIAAAAFFAVMGAAKIMGLVKAVGGLAGAMKKLSNIFSVGKLKTLGIITVIVILALLIEDFIQFMKGNDSVIGTFFDKAGIGSDNARQTIIKTWNKVKKFLTDTWNRIKERASEIWSSMKETIQDHVGPIKESLEEIWGGIETVLGIIWDNLSGLAEEVFGGILDFISGLDFEGAFEAIVSAIDDLLGVLGDVGNWISEHEEVMDALVVVLGSIAAAIGIVKGAMALYNVVSGIMTAVTAAMAGGFSIASVAGGILAGVIGFITSPVTIAVAAIAALIAVGVLLYKNWDKVKEIAGNVWNGIRSTIGKIKDAIVEGFTAAIDWIKELPSRALEWGSDIISGIVDGIKGAIGKVTEAVSGVADKIKSFLHFSVPDEGPLTDYQSWMPDFMGGLADSMVGSSSKIDNVIKTISGNMKAGFGEAFLGAAGQAATGMDAISKVFLSGMNKIASYMKMLPAQAVQWGMNFMAGFRNGILSGMAPLIEAVRSAANEIGGAVNGIATLTNAATAQVATANAGMVSNSSSSVVQNVNIDNSYSGGSTETQKNVSTAMKKSATDATTQMARALAYARG